jgi:isocitrate dehydrogenase
LAAPRGFPYTIPQISGPPDLPPTQAKALPMSAPTYEKLKAPTTGTRVTVEGGKWKFPDDPIVCLLRGDGIGQDVGGVPGITTCAVKVLDAAVEKSYKGKR